ncbi:MAG TPA: effector binding domain-containing protein [Myxococcaceae bacterium]|nr:effector binding domain-containing protein [Myxococcaceae bacterium]
METKTETLPAFTVVGIAAKESNDRPDQIGKLWQEFFNSGGVNQIPNRKSDDIFAVYTEYEGDHTKPYTMVIGCQVEQVESLPTGLVAKTLPGAKYTILKAKGPQPATVVNTWKHVYNAPLDRAYVADFDRYRGPEEVEVHVGVR